MENNTVTTTASTEQQWSFTQKATIAITSKISSSLSIFGSSYIIYHSLSNYKRTDPDYVKRVRHRLLIMLSVCDLVSSFANFTSTWAIPKDMGQDFVFNIGNQATCDAQGFILHCGSIGAALYNMSLSVYFYMCVREGSKKIKILKIIEPIFHTISIGFPLGVAIFCLTQEYFNPILSIGCYISEYPQGCVGDECIRGENAQKVRIFGIVLPLVICIVVITISMILLYKVVKRQEEAIISYTRRWSVGVGPSTLRTQRIRPSVLSTQSKKVLRQAMLYIGAFTVVWITPLFQMIIVRSLINDSLGRFYARLFGVILRPAQGFFNMLVYMRYNPVQRLIAMIRSSSATRTQQSDSQLEL